MTMKFLCLLMVTILLLQELPFAVSHDEKDHSQNGQRRKAKSQASVRDTKSEEINNIPASDDKKTVSCRPLSDEEAKTIVTEKGILKNPAVSLVTVSGNLLNALKAKETVTITVPELRKNIPNQQDLCGQKVCRYTGMTPHGKLAYRIEGYKCSNSGQSCSIPTRIKKAPYYVSGECVEEKSIAVIPVFKKNGCSFDKTVEFVSSCKCKKLN